MRAVRKLTVKQELNKQETNKHYMTKTHPDIRLKTNRRLGNAEQVK